MHIRFSGTEEVLDQMALHHPAVSENRQQVEDAFSLLKDCFLSGGKLLLCGNGGSAADSLHIAGELMKSFILPRTPDPAFQAAVREQFPKDAGLLLDKLERGLPAIPLVENVSLATAIQNDTAPKLVFAQQVYALGKQGDVLLGISTSGNSENVVYAVEVARALGMQVISLTGKGPNRLTELSNCQIAVRETEPFLVQELHLPIYHALCLMLEHAFFGKQGE